MTNRKNSVVQNLGVVVNIFDECFECKGVSQGDDDEIHQA